MRLGRGEVRLLAAMSKLTRFREVPAELFRLQSQRSARLRDYYVQKQLNRSSYDFVPEADGLIHPMTGDVFRKPNGMSLRPACPTLYEILGNFNGDIIYVIPKGIKLPSELVLLHEHTTHYSMQVISLLVPFT